MTSYHSEPPDDSDYLDAIYGARTASVAPPPSPTGWQPPPPISLDELTSARISPDCIVESLFFADIALQVAPGGTGKTTLNLYIAIHIALGLDLFGLRVYRPGPVVILTAEDSRPILVARLREISNAIGLTHAQIQTVCANILISDVSGASFRLTTVVSDVVLPSGNVDTLIDGIRPIRPSLIIVDPVVSFGVGESRTNDAEQALIDAGRRIRNSLNVAVMYVHHTGKQNARDRTTDQYTGRGGSSFADGSRMVFVLQPLTPSEWFNETGDELSGTDSALRIARPKLSYAPKQPDILVKRTGYSFIHFDASTTTTSTKHDSIDNQIHQFITDQLHQGFQHSQRSVCACRPGDLGQHVIRDSIQRLLATNRLQSRKTDKQSGAKSYLHPT